jgi:hypothetical protein
VGADKAGTLCKRAQYNNKTKKGKRKERKNSHKGLLPSPDPPVTNIIIN